SKSGPGPVGQVEAGPLEPFAGSHETEESEPVAVTDVALVEVLLEVEVARPSGDGDGDLEGSRVEQRDGADAGTPGHQSFPRLVDAGPERADRAHPGDHNPPSLSVHRHRTIPPSSSDRP